MLQYPAVISPIGHTKCRKEKVVRVTALLCFTFQVMSSPAPFRTSLNFRSHSIDTESINFDHHLRCGGWLNFECSKREKHSGWAIKTIYKKLDRGMLKHIPLNQ